MLIGLLMKGLIFNTMYKVIATGSTGNAVVYHKTVLVDIGIPFSKLKPYVKDLQIVLLTHIHTDHINISTLRS